MISIIAVLAALLHLSGLFIITDGQPYSFLPPLDPDLPQPKMETEGRVFRAEVGDTLLLPCRVRDLGPMILLWKKGTRVLTAGDIKVKRDDRIDLEATDLKINSVDVEDGGNYSCEIEADSEYPIVITHTVEVLVPPTLNVDPSDQRVVVRAGTTVALKCRAGGNPQPDLVWSKRNDRLPADAAVTDKGMTLTMAKVGRHHSGLYECVASNGVGKSVSKEIRLKVLFEPEVSAERPMVHGGLTYPAELSCSVYADPAAEVVWYRDTMRLDPNGRRYMESIGSRHTLIVRKVQKEDFANYSCYASNSLGRDRAYVTLRGNPNPPVFNSQVLSKSQTNYKIAWVTDSYSPIQEYKLLYRKLQDSSPSSATPTRHARPSSDDDWHNLRLSPHESLPTGPRINQFQEMYTLGPLAPDSSYEAKVKAKNQYGWSQFSRVFLFYTQGKGTSPHQNFVKKPEVQDLGLSSSSAAVDSATASVASGRNVMLALVAVAAALGARRL